MTDWTWQSRDLVEIIHAEQLQAHGGLPGIKDENALEAALARPQHKGANGEPDVFELAAAYLFGVARNYPFADGNKRTAFLAAYSFLRVHGFSVEAEQTKIIAFVLAVAAGEIDEAGAAMFFRDFCQPV